MSAVVDGEVKKSLIDAGTDFLKNRPITELLLVVGVVMLGYGLFEFLPAYGERMESSHREERKEWRSTIERCLDLTTNSRRAVTPQDVAKGQ